MIYFDFYKREDRKKIEQVFSFISKNLAEIRRF
jgi:hypothetical protein